MTLRLSFYNIKTLIPKCWSSIHYKSLHQGAKRFVISPVVEDALASNHPVVALESTIITHGMPFPQNLETALQVEEVIEKEGVVPATIGVLNGQVHVGLSKEQLYDLATRKDCVKISRRDFPYVLAKGLSGGTTVSGTMLVSHRAGIPIFVTGGIGGVHRGAETTLDISSDLTELGRTPVSVVCAGVKSILDVGKTLEYLETQGVCVSVVGPDARFPDFFTRDSGFVVPCQVESPALAALMMHKKTQLSLNTGMLFAVPIPEVHEAHGNLIKEAIDKAVKEASMKGVSGRDVTPFILSRVSEITAGQSLHSNIALIKNNAQIGSKIAAEYATLTSKARRFHPITRNSETDGHEEEEVTKRPVVVGGSVVDFVVTVLDSKLEFTGGTHNGTVKQSYGGVGRNLADALTRLQCSPFFISAVGIDNHGKALIAHNPEMSSEGVMVMRDVPTSTYFVLLDQKGEAMLGVGDMAIHQHISPAYVGKFEKQLTSAPLVVLDGNLSQRTINYTLDLCSAAKVPVWYEPTDVRKAIKPWAEGRGDTVTFASPNLNELRALCSFLRLGKVGEAPAKKEDIPRFVRHILGITAPLLHHSRAIMITLGQFGFTILRRAPVGGENDPLLPLPSIRSVQNSDPVGLYFSGLSGLRVLSVSGAGDCLAAGFIASMLQGDQVGQCGAAGLSAASLSLSAMPAVPETITPEVLSPRHQEFSLIRL